MIISVTIDTDKKTVTLDSGSFTFKEIMDLIENNGLKGFEVILPRQEIAPYPCPYPYPWYVYTTSSGTTSDNNDSSNATYQYVQGGHK